jgi:hypothetical protein
MAPYYDDGCSWCSSKTDCRCDETDICGCIDDPCPHPGGLVLLPVDPHADTVPAGEVAA